jgi:glutamate 5-kinase
MVHADYLFLMTDVDCLYDKNPRTNPDAQAIEVVEEIGALQADGMVLLSHFQFRSVTILIW